MKCRIRKQLREQYDEKMNDTLNKYSDRANNGFVGASFYSGGGKSKQDDNYGIEV